MFGNITFITTYTVTAEVPLEIPASSPVVVIAMQNCDGIAAAVRWALFPFPEH
jgi:hypothetical protein